MCQVPGGGTERENKGGGADVMKQDGEARRPRNRSQKQTTKNQQGVMAMQATNKNLDKDWSEIPQYIKSGLISALVFIMGITMRGDWLLFWAFFKRSQQEELGLPSQEQNTTVTSETREWLEERFAGVWPTNMLAGLVVSYVFFFGIGGFLHVYYYVLQKDRPQDWKCQPNKWLSGKDEIHEILVGWFSLTLGSVLSSFLSTWVINGGYTSIYFKFGEHGLLWALIEFPVVFVVTDYITYWHHRVYHLPFLYKHFHKLHHTYKQPTAFSVTAIHPVEFLNIQAIYIAPMFLVHMHVVPYCTYLMYIYFFGIIDHSGIAFKKFWWQPWQPDCIFHDNHHQYFHVNFGFNVELWDRIHGTLRQKDKIYREDIFYGKGKDLTEATSEELALDSQERQDENPLAYQDNKNKYI